MCVSPLLSQQSANKILLLPPAQSLQAGGRPQPALTLCCLHPPRLRAGFPIRLAFLQRCPGSSLHTTLVPHPLVPPCSGQAAGYPWSAESRRQSLFSAPKATVGTRDAECSQAWAALLRHRNAALTFQMRSSLVFQADAGLYSSSEFFADPALIQGSRQLVVSTTLSSFKKEKAP